MIFDGGNNITYSQDFRFFKGIPAGIDFRVEEFIDTYNDTRYKLTAYGYGDLSKPGGYGSGSLYVFGLSKEQQHEFEKALKEQP